MIKNLLIAAAIALIGFTGWYVDHSRSITNKLLDDSARLEQSVKLPAHKLPDTTTVTDSQTTNNTDATAPAVSQTNTAPKGNGCQAGPYKPGQKIPELCAVQAQ